MYQYEVKLVRVIDGDTFVCNIDLGFGIWLNNQHCRLLGVDAPEKNTEAGKNAKAYTEKWFERMTKGNYTTYVNVNAKDDKYGRRLVTLYSSDAGISLNLLLQDESMATAYDGRSKRGVTNVERKENQP
jgi:endonuclease YncB( thermonuclease family)